MELTIQQLREAATAVLDRMEEFSEGGRLTVADNYYWNIPNDKLFDIDHPVDEKDLTIGQISEDVATVLNSLQNKDEIICFDAEKLGHVLRFAALSLNNGVW